MIQALRHALHLSGSESEEITRHALEQALGEARDRDRVVDVLLPLLGKSGGPSSHEQMAWSVCRLLEELAARRPVVLCVDDLHWAEPTLLDLLERVREDVCDLPLMLLCPARPELLEQRPGWGSGGTNTLTLGLEPFGPGDVETSIAGLLAGDVPAGLSEAVNAWSGGNPLFVEEIIAHLVDAGTLAQGADPHWRVVGQLGQAGLPPTVSATVAARIDRLPSVERSLLSRMSVIGLEFTTADAELLTEADSSADPGTASPGVGSLLMSLTRRDLVRRVRSPQGDTWAFKHILVRDAAYDGLAKSMRAELHERFADGLAASEDADGGAEQAGFVAHHLEQAARYRRELGARGPEVEALVQRAVDALVVAADQARDRAQYEDHAAFLERALRLEPGSFSVRRTILAGLVDHYQDISGTEQMGEVLDAFEAALDESASALDQAFLNTMRLLREVMSGSVIDPSMVSSAAQTLVSLGLAARDPASAVRGLRVVAACSRTLGLWRDAAATSTEIIQIGSTAAAREARLMQYRASLVGDGTIRDSRELVAGLAEFSGESDRQRWLELTADALVAVADRSPEGRALLESAAARGQELYAAGKVTDSTEPNLIHCFEMSRDLDGAIAYAQRINDEYRRAGELSFASTYILHQCVLMLERGDPSDVVIPLVDEAESWTSPYDRLSVAYAAACRAILAVRSGDRDRAQRLMESALASVDQTQQEWQQADVRRWLSVVPRMTREDELERRMLLEAKHIYARKEIRSYDIEISRRLDELDRASEGT
jgi:hypothetical protein